MVKGQERNREFGADVVRCVAVLFIICVHFFLHNEFYNQPQRGTAMFVADFVRWLTYSCVPLFLVLTGYLKSECRVSKTYYKGILPILFTWLIMSGICICFKIGYRHIHKSIWEWIAEVFQYKAADYSWYIELYFGLFVLIPFLNEIFFASKKRSYHRAWLLTLTGIVFIPSLLNGNVIGGAQWNPMPDYFVSWWPIAYYFMGVYIRVYQPKVNRLLCAGMALGVCLVKAVFTFSTAGGGKFYDGISGGYSDFGVMLITALVFLFCYTWETKHHRIQEAFAHVSKRALHIYLISAVFDVLLKGMEIDFTLPEKYIWTFPVKCSLVFGLSLLASEVTYPAVVWLTGRVTPKMMK